MSSVGEPELSAGLLLHFMELVDRATEHIHKQNLVVVRDDNVEATGMECHSQGFIRELLLLDLKKLSCVIPDLDVFGTAGHNQLLTEADIHACDRLGMELLMHMLENATSFLDFRAIEGDVNLHDLVVIGYEE